MRLLYPPTLPWRFLFQRPQQLALAWGERGHEFIFVEHPNDPGAATRLEPVAPGVSLLHGDYREWLRQNPDTVVFASWAKHHDLAGLGRLLVFDSLDDFPDWREMEKIMVARADLVCCTSVWIQERTAGRHPRLVMVPNGVDPRPFRAAWSEPAPAELARIRRPRAVFSGCVGSWVDVELWTRAARATPRVHHVIVGAIWDRKASQALLRLPNVHLVEMVPHDRLIRILLHCDVGLVPFRRNEVADAADPIKAYEYLAAGLPVVSTSIPEVAKLAPHVRLADTGTGFASAIQEALRDRTEPARLQRHADVAVHSWAARAEAIERAITSLLSAGIGSTSTRVGHL